MNEPAEEGSLVEMLTSGAVRVDNVMVYNYLLDKCADIDAGDSDDSPMFKQPAEHPVADATAANADAMMDIEDEEINRIVPVQTHSPAAKRSATMDTSNPVNNDDCPLFKEPAEHPVADATANDDDLAMDIEVGEINGIVPAQTHSPVVKQSAAFGALQHGDDVLTPYRSMVRKEMVKATRKQADQVNARRQKITKVKLDVGDVCNVRVEGNVRAATDLAFLSVVVTEVYAYPQKATGMVAYKYQVACKKGYLKGKYLREQLFHLENRSAVLLGIDTTQKGFGSNLEIKDASAMCNVLGGGYSCKCAKKDCATNGRCKCKQNNSFCTSKCHGGRGNNKICTLRPPPVRDFLCSPVAPSAEEC